jgi:DNA-binding XRE family transcriptional regulator
MDWSVEFYKGQTNKNLVKLMDFHGHTIPSLSQASGVSEKTIWSMIHGRYYPRLDNVILVAHSLNCTIDYLYPINYN